MVLHRVFTDFEVLGNISVGVPSHDGGNNVELPRSETESLLARKLGGGFHQSAQILQEIGNRLAADPVLSIQDCPDTCHKNFRAAVLQHHPSGAQLQSLDNLLPLG